MPKTIGKVVLDDTLYSGADLYSDGDVEDLLLQLANDYPGDRIEDAIDANPSWPVMYHFSPNRANIIEWLPLTKEMKVLEIGSGCGAITGCLSEKCGHVDCVDLSMRRSTINATRNRNADNITIHVGNFQDIEPTLPEDYDYVFLIGVFEYGSCYISGEDPYGRFLSIVKKHVKTGGTLAIAIENKFGLKYFAGCREDHLGTFFEGLEGYPNGGSARTFTKPGFEKLFHRMGITDYSFYYPYPDYKFATTIYSDKRLPKVGELTENLRNYDRNRMGLFDEKAVFDQAIEDGEFPLFSNSYLILIGKDTSVAYVKYSTDRRAEYRHKTVMERVPGLSADPFVFSKVPVGEASKAHIAQLSEYCQLLRRRYEGGGPVINPCTLTTDGSATLPFEPGRVLTEIMDEYLAKEDYDGFAQMFRKFYDKIAYRNPDATEAVSDYDAIFGNFLIDHDRWTLIDYEWTVKEELDTDFIAKRALFIYLLEDESRKKILDHFPFAEYGFTRDEVESFYPTELEFQRKVRGEHLSMAELYIRMDTHTVDATKWYEENLKRELADRVQIYSDRGQGFSEADSYFIDTAFTDCNTIVTEVEVGADLTRLRIDPCSASCVVKIEELTLDGTPLPVNRKTVLTNGKTVTAGTYLFPTDDPNIEVTLPLADAKSRSLRIRLRIDHLEAGLAGTIAEHIRKIF